MKLLLYQDVDKLGRRGEVVDVRDGYARNFLIPRRLGVPPTPAAYKEFEIEKRRQAKREAALAAGAREIARKLEGIASIPIEVNTNDQGHLYGGVTPTMVADALRDQGLKIEPRQIEIAEPIKQVGTYEIAVHLHHDVQPRVKVWILSTQAVKVEEPRAREKQDEKKPEPPPTA